MSWYPCDINHKIGGFARCRVRRKTVGMIDCPQCGAEISDQAKACPNCGFSVKVAILGRKLERYKKEKPYAYKAFVFIFAAILTSVIGWLLLRH